MSKSSTSEGVSCIICPCQQNTIWCSDWKNCKDCIVYKSNVRDNE